MNDKRKWLVFLCLMMALSLLALPAGCRGDGGETVPSAGASGTTDETQGKSREPSDPPASSAPERTTPPATDVDRTEGSQNQTETAPKPSDPVCTGFPETTSGRSDPDPSATTSHGTEVTEPTDTSSSCPERPLRDIFDRIVPSVVSIRLTIPKTELYEQREEIFSGLIVSASGKIVTTYSLLERALDYRGSLVKDASIRVLVHGFPKSFDAVFVGGHSIADIAMLKIVNADQEEFAAARLAKNPDFTVGTPVFGIGFPSDMIARGGLTTGYMTSVYKTTYEEDGAPVGLLETDIPTLPPYAGGPLVNTKGEVIGITSGYLKRIYYQHNGYAVPSPTVSDVMKQIEEDAGNPSVKRERASLGIVVLGDADNEAMCILHGYPAGLYIARIRQESAAYAAGLSDGDILLSLNGTRMEYLSDLLLFMNQQVVGSLVEIRVYRPFEDRVLTLSCYLKEGRP